jgi:hypothetical protein
MEISIAQEVKADATIVVLVGRINHVLAEIVADAPEPVTVNWDVVGDPKSPILHLKLTYDGHGGTTTINPTEIENPYRLKVKLRELWGNIIQVSLHELVVRMNARLREEVGS